MATPIAKNHCLNRFQLDTINTSDIAPIVQNPVFCITIPNAKVIANVAQRTDPPNM
jgi:hypothetical protein